MTGLQTYLVNSETFLFIFCRPHSTDSATHRKMTLSLADRCSKTQKIRILPMAGRDPECQRTEMIKVCLLTLFQDFWFPTCSLIISYWPTFVPSSWHDQGTGFMSYAFAPWGENTGGHKAGTGLLSARSQLYRTAWWLRIGTFTDNLKDY